MKNVDKCWADAVVVSVLETYRGLERGELISATPPGGPEARTVFEFYVKATEAAFHFIRRYRAFVRNDMPPTAVAVLQGVHITWRDLEQVQAEGS